MKLSILLLASVASSASADIFTILQYSFRCGDQVFYCGPNVDNGKDCVQDPEAKHFHKLDPQGVECRGLEMVVETEDANKIFNYQCPIRLGKTQKLSEWTSYDCNRQMAYRNTPAGGFSIAEEPEEEEEMEGRRLRPLYNSMSCDWRHPPAEGKCGGDPHFSTYDGTKYSYHGECDLVMARSPSFHDVGLDLHIRTKGMGFWSLISNAALRIGDDVFEFTNDGAHFVNGKPLSLPFDMAGRYTVTKERTIIEKELDGRIETIDKTSATIDLGNDKYIRFTRLNKGIMYIKVNVYLPDTEGMLGVHGVEGLVGRGGRKLDEADEMGTEWQVNDTEPMLFHELRAPQYPEACVPAANQRKLRQSGVEYERAVKACVNAEDEERDFCISDVLLSGDVESALPYSFGEAF